MAHPPLESTVKLRRITYGVGLAWLIMLFRNWQP